MEKISFRVSTIKSEYEGIYIKEWRAFIGDQKTAFYIQGYSKQFYNRLYEDDPCFEKNSMKTYGAYEDDPRCIDGFIDEFSTLKEAKQRIIEILKWEAKKKNDQNL